MSAGAQRQNAHAGADLGLAAQINQGEQLQLAPLLWLELGKGRGLFYQCTLTVTLMQHARMD